MIASKEYVINKLNEQSLFPKKKYGQNFLIDEKVVKIIIESLDIKSDDVIYEIGPGLGALSELLAEFKVPLYLYDIDENMVEHLKTTFSIYPYVQVILKDFLKVKQNHHVNKIIGNLPYYITTPLIEHVLLNYEFDAFVFMVQSEVLDRLVAKPKTKEYGPLSIIIEQMYDFKRVCKASKNCFYPIPHVDSSVFKITPKNIKDDKKEYYKFLKSMFAKRRKTILNNLSDYLNSKEKALFLLNELEIDILKRPEELGCLTLYNLFLLTKNK